MFKKEEPDLQYAGQNLIIYLIHIKPPPKKRRLKKGCRTTPSILFYPKKRSCGASAEQCEQNARRNGRTDNAGHIRAHRMHKQEV